MFWGASELEWTRLILSPLFYTTQAGRPIPVPGSGKQITQLGHVKDLATAFVKILGNPRAAQQTYNISGDKARVWPLEAAISEA